MAATGGTRDARHAGTSAETTVTTTPTTRAMIEQGHEHGGDAEAQDEADDRATDADGERLDEHRASDLAAAGSHRPHERHLPPPLGHDDRERVVDDEDPDEHRDDGEGQQEVRDERQLVLEVGLALLGDLPTGEDLQPGIPGGSQFLTHRPGHLGLRHPGVGHDADAVELAGLADELLRLRGGPQGVRGTTGAVGVSEPGDAHQVVLGGCSAGLDRHPVTDPVAGVVGAAPVDDHLPGGFGGPPVVDREAVEPVDRLPVAAEGGRAHRRVADRVAVLVDDPREALDHPLGVGHLGGSKHGVEQGRVDAAADLGAPAGVAGIDGLAGPHHCVGALEGRREQVVERLVHGVCQHQHPGHERHAERHGQQGGEQPSLVVHEPTQGNLPHAAGGAAATHGR
jgi:hypothetical protein